MTQGRRGPLTGLAAAQAEWGWREAGTLRRLERAQHPLSEGKQPGCRPRPGSWGASGLGTSEKQVLRHFRTFRVLAKPAKVGFLKYGFLFFGWFCFGPSLSLVTLG